MKRIALSLLLIIAFGSAAHAIPEVNKEINSTDIGKIKDTIISILAPKENVRIHKVDEYSVSFEFETKNELANLFFTNLRTGVKPVGRIYYQIIPFSEKTLVKCHSAFVENPGMPNEIINRNIGNKDDLAFMKNVLEKTASIVDPSYTPQYETNGKKKEIEIKKQEIGFEFDQNLIKSVDEGGEAYKAGLFVGDTIIEINGKSFNDVENPKEYINTRFEAGSSVMLLIDRTGEQKMIKLKKTLQ